MIDNRLKILYSILRYCVTIALMLFALGVVGIGISLIEEYRMNKFIDKMNEKVKQHGKMDSNT